MWVPLTFECAAGSNPFYVHLPVPSKLTGASWVCDQNQGSTRTMVIAKTGGSTICSGSVSATAGTIVQGTMSTTDAYINQKIAITETLTVTIDLSGGTAGTVVVWLNVDEFQVDH
jgi:hypothetical protein